MKITRLEIKQIIREALIEEGFFDGTKKWEKTRQENAQVLGYKLTGKPDVKKHIKVKHSHDGVSHVGITEARVNLTKIQTAKDNPPFKRIKETPQSKPKETVNEKLDWDQNDSRIASEINKVFKMANIKVLKHMPFKRGFRAGDSAIYGAFIHVKDMNGEKIVLPIEVDKEGIITYAGGPKGWHKLEKIGAINMKQGRDNLKIKSYARTADYLKQFAKLPGFGQGVLKKKESVYESKANVLKAIKIAKKMGGNMTNAVKKIEKIQKGLSYQNDVAAALRKATESVSEAKTKSNMVKGKSQRLNELEYTPADLLDIADQAESLGNLLKKFTHAISRDLDSQENRLVGKALKDYNAFFASLKKVYKAIG